MSVNEICNIFFFKILLRQRMQIFNWRKSREVVILHLACHIWDVFERWFKGSQSKTRWFKNVQFKVTTIFLLISSEMELLGGSKRCVICIVVFPLYFASSFLHQTNWQLMKFNVNLSLMKSFKWLIQYSCICCCCCRWFNWNFARNSI